MKAYLDAKREALKSYAGREWEKTRTVLEETNWLLTTLHFLKWACSRIVIGSTMGIGMWQTITTVYLLNLLESGGVIAAEAVDVETAHRVVEGFVFSNVTVAILGSAIFAALTVYKLRLYRLDGKEPVMVTIRPTDECYEPIMNMVKEFRSKQISR